MKHDIKAVIFDSDGTLLDTRELILGAFEYTLAQHGHLVPSRSAMAEHGGKTLVDCYLAFAPDGDSQLLCSTHHEFQMQRIDLLRGYEGLHDLMNAIRDAGIKIAICTSRGRHVVGMLERVGIDGFCCAIVTKDDVTKHKPDPEGILKALKILQVEAARSVMVGDTEADIKAGRNAGVAYTIGLTHGLGTRGSLEEAGTDHIAGHLSEIFPILSGEHL